jgi:DNA-binding XRE family transcriptional regulator
MNIEAEVINLNLPLAFSTKDALTDAIEDIFS